MLRKRALNRLFTTHYTDLLKAICNDNYEGIESLCEGKLTEELAAKVYQWEKFNNVQFRIINDEKPDIET